MYILFTRGFILLCYLTVGLKHFGILHTTLKKNFFNLLKHIIYASPHSPRHFQPFLGKERILLKNHNFDFVSYQPKQGIKNVFFVLGEKIEFLIFKKNMKST